MVQIPMSVYEKIARSIQQTVPNPSVSMSPDRRQQFQSEAVDVTSEHLQAQQRKELPDKAAYAESRNDCDVLADQLPT